MRVMSALSARVGQLNLLVTEVNDAPHLATDDRASLLADLESFELPGIESLESQVPTGTTCSALHSLAYKMVYGYRVYLLVTPQTHLTIVADHEAYTDGALASSMPAITQSVSSHAGQGKRASASKSSLEQAALEVAAAQSAINGLDTTLLEQTPPQYPGDAPVLMGAQSSEVSARGYLNSAKKDLGNHG